MANEENATLTTDKSTEEAIAAGTKTLQSLGLNVAQTGADSLEAKGGNQLMIYWIGLIAPESMVPVEVSYKVSDSGTSRQIEMHTRASVGLTLYRWRSRARAANVSRQLTEGVSAALGQPPPAAS